MIIFYHFLNDVFHFLKWYKLIIFHKVLHLGCCSSPRPPLRSKIWRQIGLQKTLTHNTTGLWWDFWLDLFKMTEPKQTQICVIQYKEQFFPLSIRKYKHILSCFHSYMCGQISFFFAGDTIWVYFSSFKKL